MKYTLPLGVVFFWLCATGACSTADLSGTQRSRGGEIETREQLMHAVNLWMKKHDQPELTPDELLGRIVDEACLSSVLWKELEPPVESFVVSFKRNKKFKRPIGLRTVRVDKIKLSSSGQLLSVPDHDALSLHIVVKRSDIWSSDDHPQKAMDLSWPIGTALRTMKPRVKPAGSKRLDFPITVRQPNQLLSVLNAWSNEVRGPAVTLDEIIAETTDEMLFRHDLNDGLNPPADSFLKSLVKDSRFEYPTVSTVNGVEEVYEIKTPSSAFPIRLVRHEAFSVEIADHPLNDKAKRHHQVVVNWTRFIISYAFATKRRS